MTEKLKLNMDKVVDSDWRDDIDTDYAKQEDCIDFIAYKNERSYVSPEKIDEQSIEKIKSLKRGQTISGIFKKEEKLAA